MQKTSRKRRFGRTKPDVIFVVYMENSGDDGEDVKSTCVAKVMEDPAFASLML